MRLVPFFLALMVAGPAFAQNVSPDMVCFIRDKSGRLIDLESLCGVVPAAAPTATNAPAAPTTTTAPSSLPVPVPPGGTAPSTATPTNIPPPRYKMASVTWLGVFFTISILNRLLVPLLVGLPVLLRTLLVTGLTVALLTYVIMPRLTQLFRKWLYPI